MKLHELREVLRTAEAHYRNDGRGDIADGLSSALTNLLIGDDSETVSAFVRRIKQAWKPTAARPAGRSGRTRRVARSPAGSR
jgi:hypothetical protein